LPFEINLQLAMGHNLQARFIIKNIGRGVLTLYGIKAGCKCTKTHIDKNILQPNQEAVLTAEVHFPSTPGNWEDKIILYSNDLKSPIENLRLTVFIQPRYSIFPPSFVVDELPLGGTKDIELT